MTLVENKCRSIYHLKYFIISRFQKGLSTLGVLEVIWQNPETMKRVSTSLTCWQQHQWMPSSPLPGRQKAPTSVGRKNKRWLSYWICCWRSVGTNSSDVHMEVFSVLAIQKTFDQGSPFANYPLVGTFNHIHFGGKSWIMSGTRSK